MKRRHRPAGRPPLLSFDSWAALKSSGHQTLSLCHPDWRGVRTAAHSFAGPVVEAADLAEDGERLIAEMTGAGVEVAVVHGFPPGTPRFLETAAAAGIGTRCVIYSSPAQHGAERGEVYVVEQLVQMLRDGTLHRLGVAKDGFAEGLTALGHPATFVPARLPSVPATAPADLGPGTHIGVFGEPFWRKNVVTQLVAASLLQDAIAHVLSRPDAHYLESLPVVEHGVVGRADFLPLLGAVTVNLYVSLSECLPFTPLESYLLGVPCLTSRTSALFRSEPDLWELTTVGELDSPRAIAEAAGRLMANREEAVAAAGKWMDAWDRSAGDRWEEFTTG